VNDLAEGLRLKERLARTWSAFFERHGNFTPVQYATLPVLIDGHNAIICASTASGKTEAAVAPLVERYCFSHELGLRLLYITPTRALANDLVERLSLPLESLQLTLAIKTRDLNTFKPRKPAHVLVSTPEAIDSLLTSYARVFSGLRGIILDELHLLDGTARGDQLRAVLNRLYQIKAYAASQGQSGESGFQVVGLSATVSDPQTVAARYMTDAKIIQLQEKRAIQADVLSIAPENADPLSVYLYAFRQRGWRKAMVFCNTRAEVEQYAAATHLNSPFGNAVYVHYSNIAADRRREIETQFALDEAAVCFTSSTLELGIDIGNIDVVILIGAPGSLASFVQRIGRGSRRKPFIQAACFYRTPLEKILFEIYLTEVAYEENYGGFLPSIAIQQIFSLIKQSPTGTIRISMLRTLFEGLLSLDALYAIVGHLSEIRFLQMGRPGEWKAGERLNQLVDMQSYPDARLSIYSNLENTAGMIQVRDRHTGREIAQVQRWQIEQDVFLLEGRTFQAHWQDEEALWVSSQPVANNRHKPRFGSALPKLSFEVAQLIPKKLGLKSHQVPLIPADEGYYLFHWLGDIYGKLFLDLLRYQLPAQETDLMGLYVWLPDEPSALPQWSETQVYSYLQDRYQRFEVSLELGAFHTLLPDILRRQAVIEKVNPPRFLTAVSSFVVVPEEGNNSFLWECIYSSS
jgi:ATP-dependent helicase Lhr and Lhr-like helicase